MSACEETNTKVVKELLEARPDVNLVNQKVTLMLSQHSNCLGILSTCSLTNSRRNGGCDEHSSHHHHCIR